MGKHSILLDFFVCEERRRKINDLDVRITEIRQSSSTNSPSSYHPL
jgi:hypothetical protein